MLTSNKNWSFGLTGFRLNTPFPYYEIRGWSERFMYGGMRIIAVYNLLIYFANTI